MGKLVAYTTHCTLPKYQESITYKNQNYHQESICIYHVFLKAEVLLTAKSIFYHMYYKTNISLPAIATQRTSAWCLHAGYIPFSAVWLYV